MYSPIQNDEQYRDNDVAYYDSFDDIYMSSLLIYMIYMSSLHADSTYNNAEDTYYKDEKLIR